jgi:hypothetical protein
MAAMRSPRVFGHAQALGAEDLEEIVADYSNDAIFITPAGVQRGKDGIHQAFAKLLGEVPQATWDIKTTIDETTSCYWSGAPRAAATVSRTASTPSSSATASSGSRPSRYTCSPLPERRGWRCDRTSSSTPKV